MTQQLTEIARGLRFPEGPIAMPDGTFYVVEIEKGCLSKIEAGGRTVVVAMTGGGPNGAAIGPDGKCYVCNNGGHSWREDAALGLLPAGPSGDYTHGWIDRVDLATGAVERLYEASDKGPLRSPNDLVFDHHGGFWFTDLGKARHRDVDRGAICYARADGTSIREAIFPMLSPNGIGLSANEDELYVAETQSGRLWAFDIAEPGKIKRSVRWPQSPHGGRMLFGPDVFQGFDSLGVDSAGRVCVATVFKGGITLVSPLGKAPEFIEMPDPLTTTICFGGPDLRTAYITLSSTGRLVSMPWPVPGLPLNFVNC